MPDAVPLSPCINRCGLDPRGTCVGCYRTMDEIARWGAMSPDEQRDVLRSVAARRAANQGMTPASEPLKPERSICGVD